MATQTQQRKHTRRLTFPWRRYISPFYSVLWLVLAVMIPLEFAWCRTVHLTGAELVWTASLPGMAVLVACLLYCMWRPLPKLVEPVELVIVSVVLAHILSILMQIAGRSHHPLMDPEFAHFDALLHMSTVAVVHWFAGWPVLRDVLAAAYNLIAAFLVAAVVVPAVCEHKRASQRLILAVVLAALITAAVAWMWPAVGPWSAGGFAPSRIQSLTEHYLLQLRSGAPLQLNMTHAATVAFPSFHVVLAVLCAAALSSVRRLRIPAWCFAVLVGISTVALGWHYGADVLAGLAVAVISYALAYPIVRAESWSHFRIW